MAKIVFKNGEKTEELFQFILSQIDDEILDEMEVRRELKDSTGLAAEPITTSVAIAASSLIIISLTRLMERWLEQERQIKHVELAIEAFGVSEEAGEAVKSIAKKHSEVAVSYELMKNRKE